MDQGPYWADSCSCGQEIRRLLWNVNQHIYVAGAKSYSCAVLQQQQLVGLHAVTRDYCETWKHVRARHKTQSETCV
jgi:hypothetical protein